jgi:hypothetical protein
MIKFHCHVFSNFRDHIASSVEAHFMHFVHRPRKEWLIDNDLMPYLHNNNNAFIVNQQRLMDIAYSHSCHHTVNLAVRHNRADPPVREELYQQGSSNTQHT